MPPKYFSDLHNSRCFRLMVKENFLVKFNFPLIGILISCCTANSDTNKYVKYVMIMSVSLAPLPAGFRYNGLYTSFTFNNVLMSILCQLSRIYITKKFMFGHPV